MLFCNISFSLILTARASTLGGIDICSIKLFDGLGGSGGRLLGVIGALRRGDWLGVESTGDIGCFKNIDTSRRSPVGVTSRTGSRAVTRRDLVEVVLTGSGARRELEGYNL